MTMIYGPISFLKLVQKIIIGIWGKIFEINLHNLQMLFMLKIKYKFSKCLAPLRKHEGPQWETFWRRLCPGPQTQGAFEASYPKFFIPLNFVVLKNFVLNIW